MSDKLREQLAEADVKCQYPGCTAQATGMLVIGSTVPFLCDSHITACNEPDARRVVERELLHLEDRTRYPNGLTREEWHIKTSGRLKSTDKMR